MMIHKPLLHLSLLTTLLSAPGCKQNTSDASLDASLGDNPHGKTINNYPSVIALYEPGPMPNGKGYQECFVYGGIKKQIAIPNSKVLVPPGNPQCTLTVFGNDGNGNNSMLCPNTSTPSYTTIPGLTEFACNNYYLYQFDPLKPWLYYNAWVQGVAFECLSLTQTIEYELLCTEQSANGTTITLYDLFGECKCALPV